MSKVIGHMTEFPMLKYYRKLLMNEITIEEYSKIEDVEPITTPIYKDAVRMMGEMEDLLFQKQYLEKLLGTVQTKISILEHTARKKVMDNCQHNMVYEGHGHNDDYYKCSHCGYSEWQ
jgi:hypothetical protein